MRFWKILLRKNMIQKKIFTDCVWGLCDVSSTRARIVVTIWEMADDVKKNMFYEINYIKLDN